MKLNLKPAHIEALKNVGTGLLTLAGVGALLWLLWVLPILILVIIGLAGSWCLGGIVRELRKERKRNREWRRNW